MELIALIASLLEISNVFFSLKERFSSSKRRKELGAWMYELGALIDNTAVMIEQNNYPHNNCSRMRYLVDQFPQIFSDAFSETEIKELQSKMFQVTEIERMFGELSQIDTESRKRNIIELYEIAGGFMAVGDTLKHSK